MKISLKGVIISSALVMMAASIFSQRLWAADLNSQDIASKIVNQDTGVKGRIKAVKQKIAEEREGILAAGRRLSQVKKTGDKVAVEQVKKEVDADIKERKSAISTMKTEIEKLQGSAESLAPSSKGRADEGR